ncbi:hypothetical protein [Neorhizobium sp. NCHU2750]|nr:hypothetical protein NCHU2750_33150 [Neorhizobium sp. NCHU2750]
MSLSTGSISQLRKDRKRPTEEHPTYKVVMNRPGFSGDRLA